jgi:drug/metabolite transporter (DMT)-like permease
LSQVPEWLAFAWLPLAAVTAGFLLRNPRWRRAGAVFAVLTGWGAVVAWVSPKDQFSATEVWWIIGLWAGVNGVVAGAGAAWLLSVFGHTITRGGTVWGKALGGDALLAVMGVVLLGEPLTWPILLGTALVIGGVMLVARVR